MFNRHKFTAIAVVLFSLMAVAALPTGFTVRVKSVVARFYAPPQRFIAAAADTVRAKTDQMKSRDELLKENEQLRAELQRLQMDTPHWQETERENERLRQMLQLRGASRPRWVAARVIARDPSNWWKSLRIDRGSKDGIALNSAVVAPGGLVGKIVSVSDSESHVLLLVDRSCKVSGIIQNTREPGLITGGIAELGPNPRCRMTFIAKQAKIEPNSVVVSSGLGGVFPSGIVIGKITGASTKDSAGLYQEAEIEMAVDFKTLEEVFVVLK